MTTRDEEEIEKFTKMSSTWWKTDSSLLSMNAVRVPFIENGLSSVLKIEENGNSKPLEGLRILDVGCGGGFLSEDLARLGASVFGIDANEDCIRVACDHSVLDPNLKDNLTYSCITAEDLVGTIDPFDAVVCSEVIEHVNNPQLLVESCAKLTKDHGSLFFTTFNKTKMSYIGGIIFAERILKYITRGTHDWNKFISPNDLQNMLKANRCQTETVRGFLYNPIKKIFVFSSWCGIHYALHAVKQKSD